MNSLIRSLTFYFVAWLCLSNLFFSSFSSFSSVEANKCFPPIGSLKTFTQVEIGTPGTEAANLCSLHFPQLFPHGLAIGANVVLDLNTNLLSGALNLVGGILGGVLGNTRNVVLTTANSVINFLPQVASPGCLTSYLLNPSSSPAGSLAGEVVTTALNVALDANVAGFATANVNLSSLVFVQGPCAGLSVGAVLNIANAVLGQKCDSQLVALNAPLTVAAKVTECLASCNQNFLDGLKADVFLALPGFNLQAILNLNLPVLDLDTVVKAQLSLPSLPAARVYVDAELLGLDVNAALSLATPCHAWKLDTVDVALGVDVSVSSFAVAVPQQVQGLLSNLVGTVATVVVDDLLCLVNYLLNFCPSTVSGIDLQASILLLLNPSWTIDQLLTAAPWLSGCNRSLVLSLVADARLNGVGFVPSVGQIVGVVANLKVGTGDITARILLEVTVPKLDVSVETNLCVAI